MDVQVDNIWCTPSTLHLRVTVWPDGKQWRRRFDSHIPLEDIPVEALQALSRYVSRNPASYPEDVPLF